MEITRRDIANYKLLGILLEKDKKKLERYIEKRPSYYSGKVYGSNPQFPYETRGFTITGCAEYERQQALIDLYSKLSVAEAEIADGAEGEDFLRVAGELRGLVHGRL